MPEYTRLYVVNKSNPSAPLAIERIEGETAQFYVLPGGKRFSKSDEFRAYFKDLHAALRDRAARCESRAVILMRQAESAAVDATKARSDVDLTAEQWEAQMRADLCGA